MPFTRIGQAEIDRRIICEDIMDEVSCWLPVFWRDLKVGEVCVHVRANWDEALGGLTADIFAEDDTGKRHVVPEAEVRAVLNEIHDHDKDAWREINERAKADDLEGVYREAVYAA